MAEKRNERRFFFAGTSAAAAVAAAMVLVLSFSCAARAAILYGKNIEEVPGLRFENFIYAWNKVELDVVNTASYNIMFEGTMIFLDRRGKPLARASLLPKKIRGLDSERYTAYFVEGSGDMARQAKKIVWDFGAR